MNSPSWKAGANVAFIVVDVQKDFCPGGSLGAPGGDKIVPVINSLRDHFNTVVFTRDWHPAGHKLFASSRGVAPFTKLQTSYGEETLWPDHCVQGSEGAKFHPDLIVREGDLILSKGTDPEVESLSAFVHNDGVGHPKFDNGNTLAEELRERRINTNVIGGLVRDICVGLTALKSIKEHFRTIVVMDAAQPLNEEADVKMRADLEALGVEFVYSADLEKTLARPGPQIA